MASLEDAASRNEQPPKLVLTPPLLRRLRSQAGLAAPLAEPRQGQHVLYLLRTAFRCDRNPSLETALRAGAALGLPTVCLAVIEDSFPPTLRDLAPRRTPTDRSAAFRLEALRELQPAFSARGTVL